MAPLRMYCRYRSTIRETNRQDHNLLNLRISSYSNSIIHLIIYILRVPCLTTKTWTGPWSLISTVPKADKPMSTSIFRPPLQICHQNPSIPICYQRYKCQKREGIDRVQYCLKSSKKRPQHAPMLHLAPSLIRRSLKSHLSYNPCSIPKILDLDYRNSLDPVGPVLSSQLVRSPSWVQTIPAAQA